MGMVLVLVGHEKCVVRWGSLKTDAFIMAHLDLSSNELYVTHRLVQIIKEFPEEDLLDHA